MRIAAPVHLFVCSSMPLENFLKLATGQHDMRALQMDAASSRQTFMDLARRVFLGTPVSPPILPDVMEQRPTQQMRSCPGTSGRKIKMLEQR